MHPMPRELLVLHRLKRAGADVQRDERVVARRARRARRASRRRNADLRSARQRRRARAHRRSGSARGRAGPRGVRCTAAAAPRRNGRAIRAAAPFLRTAGGGNDRRGRSPLRRAPPGSASSAPVRGVWLARTCAHASCGPTMRSSRSSTLPPRCLLAEDARVDDARVVEDDEIARARAATASRVNARSVAPHAVHVQQAARRARRRGHLRDQLGRQIVVEVAETVAHAMCEANSGKTGHSLPCDEFGAGRGNRTPTVSPPADFESATSTSSVIPAVGATAHCSCAAKTSLSLK